jgi:hypothetical protein
VKSSTHVRIVADAKRALASMLSSLNFPTPKEREVLLQKDFLPMQIKKGGARMGLKRSKMGVTGNSINTFNGL